MSEAGAGSPHLEGDERAQAAEHAAPGALVIHEVIREEGEQELQKRGSAVAWSGLAAGMSMGFSFLCLSMMTSMLPDAPWRHMVASLGYTVGFVITVLGRQELFTESTLSAALHLLVRRDRATLVALLRFWGTVLAANLVGTALFARLLAVPGLFEPQVESAFAEVARGALRSDWIMTLPRAVLAGWLIALMAWTLPSARSAKLFVIMLMTFVVSLCRLPHVIAGSVEAAYAVFRHQAGWTDYLLRFLLPTLVGNSIGGFALVALLNHAPLAGDLKGAGSGAGKKSARGKGRVQADDGPVEEARKADPGEVRDEQPAADHRIAARHRDQTDDRRS